MDPEAILAVQAQFKIYYTVLSFTIQYYDYFLTLKDEIKLFWGTRLSAGSVLFLVIRYTGLVLHIPIALQTFIYLNPESCKHLQIFHQFVSITLQTMISLLLILRVYALYGCNKKIAGALIPVAIATAAVATWTSISKADHQEKLPLPTISAPGCNPIIDNSSGHRYAMGWSCLVAMDSLIFILTFYKAAVLNRDSSSPLVNIMLRDGLIYYVILTMANVSNIVTFLVAAPLLKGISVNFGNAVSVTVISRMMINVRHNATIVRLGSQQLSLPSIILPSFHAAEPINKSLIPRENSEGSQWAGSGT